ncbi:MAG TPA: Gfo/Idh/MocA family oxidoreductase, partial [Humisphaera sp.]
MKTPLSRRSFLKGSAAVAAASAAGLPGFTARSYAAVVGSNEDIRIAVIGFNSRGNSHIDAFSKMKGVRLVGLCDADDKVLEKGLARLETGGGKKPTSKPSTRPVASAKKRQEMAGGPDEEPKAPEKPKVKVVGYTDLRRVMDNKEIDAISTATPNHWHSLIVVWGCQAGKDVYVEKPVSHNVWEGRQAVEAARKYNRIVQTGTQSRSNSALKEAYEWVQKGGLGKIKVARGLCYKRRGTIGKVDGELKIPENIHYDLWAGPSPMDPVRRKAFHYDWHWQWAQGNGDLGNQGIHQMDTARWALGKPFLSPKVMSVGGRFGYEDDGQTPNTQFVVHDYGDSMLIFEVRGLPKETGSGSMDQYKKQSVGTVVECEDGYLVDSGYSSSPMAYDNKGEFIKKFSLEKAGGEGDHFANFIKAVRSRKVEDLHADILEGHLSSALCHTGNISYRLGKEVGQEEVAAAVKSNKAAAETYERLVEHLEKNKVSLKESKPTLGAFLQMDPKTERFIGDHAEDANKLLTRA